MNSCAAIVVFVVTTLRHNPETQDVQERMNERFTRRFESDITCLKTFQGKHATILKRRAVPVAVQLDGLPGWHRTGWRFTCRQPVLGRRDGALADANTEGYLDSAHCRGCGVGGAGQQTSSWPERDGFNRQIVCLPMPDSIVSTARAVGQTGQRKTMFSSLAGRRKLKHTNQP